MALSTGFELWADVVLLEQHHQPERAVADHKTAATATTNKFGQRIVVARRETTIMSPEFAKEQSK